MGSTTYLRGIYNLLQPMLSTIRRRLSWGKENSFSLLQEAEAFEQQEHKHFCFEYDAVSSLASLEMMSNLRTQKALFSARVRVFQNGQWRRWQAVFFAECLELLAEESLDARVAHLSEYTSFDLSVEMDAVWGKHAFVTLNGENPLCLMFAVEGRSNPHLIARYVYRHLKSKK